MAPLLFLGRIFLMWFICIISFSAPAQISDHTIQNGKIQLAVKLLKPETPVPHPGVVIVHGSGKGTWNFYRHQAERLRDLGFAVAYYDKRGVGGSTGVYKGISIHNSIDMFNKLSSDASAVAAWLKDQPGVDPTRVGLFGVSQAGWIIPQAAAESDHISFCVIVSGPVGSLGEETEFSDLAGDERRGQKYSDEEIEQKIRAYRGPHGFDSRTYIRKLDIPVFWIFGAKDKSMPALLSIEYLTEIIRKENKDNFSFKVYPNANHAIKDVDTGQWNDFFENEIRDWLRDHDIISN